MEPFLAALEGTGLATALRASRWGYALVNAAHIFGIALLIGAIMPLNLRLLGVWRAIPREMLTRVLVPVAAVGLGLAAVAGVMLFSIRAREYADVGFLQAKLGLIAAGTLAALWLHGTRGLLLRGTDERRLAWHAVFSSLLDRRTRLRSPDRVCRLDRTGPHA